MSMRHSFFISIRTIYTNMEDMHYKYVFSSCATNARDAAVMLNKYLLFVHVAVAVVNLKIIY